MHPSEGGRLPWEYAEGPTVGDDVPITSPPRPEEKPGVPKPPPREPSGNAGGSEDPPAEDEVREVRAEDPDLSPETNARLTEELRDVVGAERVSVPGDRPRATRGEHPKQHGPAARLEVNRFQLIRTGAIVLTFGAIIALITRDWWVLPLAAGVHALGTMVVSLTVIRLTTVSEHPSPTVAAALSEEGVSNPDEHFSRMVEEFREEPERGTTEVLSPGFNERAASASADTPAASAEQSSAMTPTAEPSHPAGAGGAPDALIWTTMISLLVLSIVLPALTGGGWMWLLTAVMVPLIAGWAMMQRVMITRRNPASPSRSSPGCGNRRLYGGGGRRLLRARGVRLPTLIGARHRGPQGKRYRVRHERLPRHGTRARHGIRRARARARAPGPDRRPSAGAGWPNLASSAQQVWHVFRPARSGDFNP